MSSVIPKLAKARLEFGEILKDVQGYDYKYANLDGMVKAVIEPLSKNGVAVFHTFDPLTIGEEHFLSVTCHVSDGESEITSSIPFPLKTLSAVDNKGKPKNSAQEMGKIITYGRRYTLAAALCLTADEDTDAQVSKDSYYNAPLPPPSQKPVRAVYSSDNPAAVTWLAEKFIEHGIAEDRQNTLKAFAIGKTRDEIEDVLKQSTKKEIKA